MDNFKTIDEILDYAIKLEQDAVTLYTRLADNAKRPEIKKAFLDFADEERGHEARLKRFKSGETSLKLPGDDKILDLKILDYNVDIKLEPSSSYQDILLFAMRQEKQAFRLYTDLAARTEDPDTKSLFLKLAEEEAKHKLRFEIEYDDNVLTEN
jgi:rubrerythrin